MNHSGGSVQLSPAYSLTRHELFSALQEVFGVRTVVWRPIVRGVCDTIEVTSTTVPGTAIKFHVSAPNEASSVTVSFKKPNIKLVPEAWRILRGVTRGKELSTKKVDKVHYQVLRRWKQTMDRMGEAVPSRDMEQVNLYRHKSEGSGSASSSHAEDTMAKQAVSRKRKKRTEGVEEVEQEVNRKRKNRSDASSAKKTEEVEEVEEVQDEACEEEECRVAPAFCRKCPSTLASHQDTCAGRGLAKPAVR